MISTGRSQRPRNGSTSSELAGVHTDSEPAAVLAAAAAASCAERLLFDLDRGWEEERACCGTKEERAAVGGAGAEW